MFRVLGLIRIFGIRMDLDSCQSLLLLLVLLLQHRLLVQFVIRLIV